MNRKTEFHSARVNHDAGCISCPVDTGVHPAFCLPGAVPVPLVRGEKQRKGKNDAARSSCLRARVHLFFLSDDALRSDAPLSSSEFSAPREHMG